VLGPVIGLVALGFCGLLMVGILLGNLGGGAVLVGAVCALVPVGPVVYAFLWMDRWEPEPPRMLLAAFLWGACFAALAALVINTSVEVAVSLVLGSGAETVSAVFVAPFVEEGLKGLFLLLLFWFRRREFDGILDGIVYAGLVAAGFAFSENVLYLGKAFAAGVENGTHGAVLTVLVMRGLFTPFAHPLFTAMTGIGLGIAANARNTAVRLLAPCTGYLIAVCLHALWNGSASLADGQALPTVYLLIMVPLFAFTLLLVLYQRRREQRIIAAELPGFAHAGWIAPSEVGLLQSLAGRRGWRKAVELRSGPAAAKAVHEYQGAVTELAFLRHKMARGSVGPAATQWHEDLLEAALHARGRAIGMPEALTAAWARRQPPPDWTPPQHGHQGHHAQQHNSPAPLPPPIPIHPAVPPSQAPAPAPGSVPPDVTGPIRPVEQARADGSHVPPPEQPPSAH
jgi:RsiW-degrading membrane proteinase PrsW (M82 family)